MIGIKLILLIFKLVSCGPKLQLYESRKLPKEHRFFKGLSPKFTRFSDAAQELDDMRMRLELFHYFKF